MRTLALTALALLSALLPAHVARAAACGLPDSKPLWIDYAEGSVGFRDAVFARPGIVVATSGTAVPQALRNGGAQTVYWHMKLGALVGTTTAPADPAAIGAAAQKLFDTAVASSGCSTPMVALNELNGASTTTPWTTTNARYRQNVLDLLQALQSHGARPFLLVNSFPYTGGDAADWWRQAAQVADIVPEVYFNAPAVMRQGVILGSRRMRTSLRNAIAAYTAIGIPVSRLGFVLGFSPGRALEGARASSRRACGSGSRSCTRWRPSGWRRSSASPRSGRGGGGRSMPPVPIRTRRRPPACTSGRGTRRSATGPATQVRISRPRAPRARSRCRRASNARSTAGSSGKPTSRA